LAQEHEDLGDVLRRFEESAERARVKRTTPRPRRRPSKRWLLAAGAGVATVACAVGISSEAGVRTEQSAASTIELRLSFEQRVDRPAWPVKGAESEAREIAGSRKGLVSFDVIGPGGRTLSFEPDRQFFSASVSKVMLLVAELRRLRREGTPLDATTRSLLTQMITFSDNDAADAIYARVGDAGLNEVAKLAGMSQFSGDVGHWSNVQFSASDLALFMSKLDQLLDLPTNGSTRARGRTATGNPPPASSRARTQCATVL